MQYQKLTSLSQQGHYRLRVMLQGNIGPVACIVAHPLGTHIACGGMASGLFCDLCLIEMSSRRGRHKTLGLTNIQTTELSNKIEPQRYHHSDCMDHPSRRYRGSFGFWDKRRLSMHMETGKGGKCEIYIPVIPTIYSQFKVH